ncbi:endothelin-converting enzyme 2-like [Amblyomma americanum]
MERVALRSTIASFVVLVIFSLALSLYMLTSRATTGSGGRGKQVLCTTISCRQYAHLLTALVNESISPCDDLEAFACSKWASRVASERGPPFGYGSALMGLMLADWFAEFERELSSATERLATGHHALAAFEACMADKNPGVAAKSSNVLRQFMRERRILWPESPEEGVHPLAVLLDLAYNWGIGLWFDTRLQLRGNTRKLELLLTVGEMMPYWASYQRYVEKQDYEAYWKSFSVVFGGSGKSSPGGQHMKRVATAEAHICQEFTQVYQRTDKKPARIDIANMSRYTPSLSSQEWTENLNATVTPGQRSGYGPIEKLLVSDTALLAVVSNLFGNYSRPELLEHISWFFVQVFAPLVTSDIYSAMYRVKSAGDHQHRIFCSTEVEAMFGPLVASLYAANRFSAESRQILDNDFTDVGFTVRDKIASLSSVDNATLNLIAEKLATAHTVLWPPPDLNNGTSAVMHANSSMKHTFVESWIEARRNTMRLAHSGPTFERELRVVRNYRLPFFAYDYLTNSVLVSLASLGDRAFVQFKGTASMRFGGIGFEYARQLVRAFDDVGLRVDSQGNVRDRPLSSLAINPSECAIMGGDGIRELPALEVAYAAFKRRANESTLRTMKKYSEEEVFFITACFNLCRQPTTMRGVFAGGCNEAAANFAPFSQAFNCHKGATMNPTKTCSYFN